MTKVKVFSIPDFIIYYDRLISGLDKYLIIFITLRNDYKYDFNVVKLDIGDVERFQQGFINDTHLDILSKIPYEKYDKIFVCCDAGMSRSPAIASAILYYLKQREDALDMMLRYKYMNIHLYDEVLNKLKDKGEKEK